jgi:glycine oxidase
MKVLILGGGAIGLSCAYYLARAGTAVVVVDRGELGQEASWAGAGMITAHSLRRAHTPIGRLKARGAAVFPELSAELRELTGVDNGYLRCGALELRCSAEVLARRQAELQEDDESESGHAGQVLSATELRAVEPALHPDLPGAIRYAEAAQVRNPWHLRALVAGCQRLGVDLRPGQAVLAIRRTGQRITEVTTSAGPLAADCVLVCAGAWSGELLAGLGVHLPVKPIRGQIVLLRATPDLLRHLLLAGPRYLVPRSDGRVLVGSTEEDVGFDKNTTASAVRDLIHLAVGYVPALANCPVERCWAGLRPGSADGKPVLGGVPGLENLFVAAGHFRSGLQLSAITGILMTQLLLGEQPELDLTPFRLDRFDVSDCSSRRC